MPEDPRDLFDEYATRYARGERPRAEDYLARAGPKADRLAEVLDRFVASAAAPPAHEDEVALVEAWAVGQPPLVEVRARRGIRVDAVVQALESDLALDPAKRPKLKRYYQRLEQGLLDPGDVSRAVWDVLARVLGPVAAEASAWRTQFESAELAYFRAAAPAAPAAAAGAPSQPPEDDEIDRLFSGADA